MKITACVWTLLMSLTVLMVEAHEPNEKGRVAPLQVIVHGARPELSMEQDVLRAIFMLRLREWPDGQRICVFVLPEQSSLHQQFSREILGLYPYLLRRIWDQCIFTGVCLAPVVVETEESMRQSVRLTPGAIGYMTRLPKKHRATGIGKSDAIRTLHIDGLHHD